MSITIHHLSGMRGPCKGKPFTILIRESQHATTAGSVLTVLHYTRQELETLGDQILHALHTDEAYQVEQAQAASRARPTDEEPVVLVEERRGNWHFRVPSIGYTSQAFPTETDARRAAARTGYPFPQAPATQVKPALNHRSNLVKTPA